MSLEKAAVVDSGNWDIISWRRVIPGVKHVLIELESYDVATVSKQSQKLLVKRILARCPRSVAFVRRRRG